MVSPRLYIADPQDPDWPIQPSSASVELNGQEQGDPLGFAIVDDIDFGQVGIEETILSQPPYPGGIQAIRRHKETTLTVRLMLQPHNDYPTLAQRIIDLGEALDTHGVIVWEYDAGQDPVYIDFMPSAVATILRGVERGANHILSQFMDPDGYPVDVVRQPYFRLSPITGITRNVSTGPRNRDLLLTNPGNVPALCYLSIKPPTNGQTVQVRAAVKSAGNLTEFRQIYGKEAEQTTSGAGASTSPEATVGGTSAAGDNGASAGTGLKTFFAGGTGRTLEHYRRWYDIVLPGDTRSIEGRYRVFFGVKFTAAVSIEMKYGFTADLTQPCELSGTGGTPVDIGYEAQAPVYTEVDMGLLTVPIGTTTLRIEAWAGDPADAATSGTVPPIWWDYYVLMPADEQSSIISSTGFRSGGVASRLWKPRDITLRNQAGTTTEDSTTGGSGNQGDYFLLNDLNETAFTKPSTGIQLPGGRYVVEASGSVRDLNDTKEEVARARVEYTTDATGATGWAILPDESGANTEAIIYAAKGSKSTSFDKRLSFTADPSNRYRYSVKQTATNGGAGSRETHVRQIQHSFVKTVKGNDSIVLDGFRGAQAIYNSAGDRIWSLAVQGPYIEIPPGDALLIVTPYEIPPTNYDDIDVREPLAKVDPSKTYAVRADMIPRRMGA